MTDRVRQTTPRQQAVTAMHHQHAAHIHALARKALQGDVHAANDIVSETFMAAFKQYHRDFEGKSPGRVEALLVTIAKRRVVDLFRGNRAVSGLDEFELPNEYLVSRCDLLSQIIERDTWERVWAVIAKILTVTENQVAWLSWQLGMPDHMIARVLGIPTVGTVRTHRSRAKKKIKQEGFPDIIFPDDRDDS